MQAHVARGSRYFAESLHRSGRDFFFLFASFTQMDLFISADPLSNVLNSQKEDF